MIINLFQNSLRYAYPEGNGGKIDIRVERVERERGSGFRIGVRDYGPGVAPEV